MANTRSTVRYAAIIIFVIAIIGAAFLFKDVVTENHTLQAFIDRYGLFAVFIISVISGFNIAVPIPVVSFVPAFAAAGLDAWVVVATIALGMTAGDSLGYLIGKIGRDITYISVQRIRRRLEYIRTRFRVAPLVVLFLFVAFVPFPNEILVIPLGFLGYSFRIMFPTILFGNVLFNTFSYIGIVNIFSLL